MTADATTLAVARALALVDGYEFDKQPATCQWTGFDFSQAAYLERARAAMGAMPAPASGGWTTGRLLLTADTRRWGDGEKAAAAAVERRMVFRHFSAADEGKSRERVAVFEREEDAALAAHAVNTLPEITKAADDFRGAVDGFLDWLKTTHPTACKNEHGSRFFGMISAHYELDGAIYSARKVTK